MGAPRPLGHARRCRRINDNGRQKRARRTALPHKHASFPASPTQIAAHLMHAQLTAKWSPRCPQVCATILPESDRPAMEHEPLAPRDSLPPKAVAHCLFPSHPGWSGCYTGGTFHGCLSEIRSHNTFKSARRSDIHTDAKRRWASDGHDASRHILQWLFACT
jgi:hypothetical protein